MAVPTIDPGEMLYCEDTCQEGFDTMQVNEIQVNGDNEKESDKDSEGNSMEKMSKKKVRKFVSNDSDHNAPDNDLVAKTSQSGIGSMEGEKLDDDFQLEMDTEGKNGNDDGNNDGNVEQPVGKCATTEPDGTERDDNKEKEKSNDKEQKTEKMSNKEKQTQEKLTSSMGEMVLLEWTKVIQKTKKI